eukprot:g16821.t1
MSANALLFDRAAISLSWKKTRLTVFSQHLVLTTANLRSYLFRPTFSTKKDPERRGIKCVRQKKQRPCPSEKTRQCFILSCSREGLSQFLSATYPPVENDEERPRGRGIKCVRQKSSAHSISFLLSRGLSPKMEQIQVCISQLIAN